MNLVDLRTWDHKGWRFNLHLQHCPECSCLKSGYVEEPNGQEEWCSDANCLCHDEDAW